MKLLQFLYIPYGAKGDQNNHIGQPKLKSSTFLCTEGAVLSSTVEIRNYLLQDSNLAHAHNESQQKIIATRKATKGKGCVNSQH